MGVTIFSSGQMIGRAVSVESVNMKEEYKALKASNSIPFYQIPIGRTYTVHMEDIKINDDYLEMASDKDKLFKLVAEGWKLPKGRRMPKTKRLRKKYTKLYRYKITFEDVKIENLK